MYARKITPTQICQIPELLKQGESISGIARTLGVTAAAIRSVILEEKWKRYTNEPRGMIDRCPDCGTMVVDDTKPCMTCIVNRRMEQDRLLRPALQ